jgi:signal transduction histidine kinase
MNDIVLPLYLALACIFVGITVAGRPGQETGAQPDVPASVQAGVRSGFLGLLAGLTAALACMCIALVPLIGRGLLPVSTLLLWVSFAATTLRVRSWRLPVSSGFALQTFGGLTLLAALMVTQFIFEPVQLNRVVFQFLASVGLLGWMMRELVLLDRQQPSAQLRLMRWSVLGMVLVLCVWSWALSGQDAGNRMLMISALFSEASLAFAMRLFLVAMVVLLFTGANGYSLERMAWSRARASAARQQAESRNQQLQGALLEKNEMLQALSFAARSQNLPAIMGSLSHEINQPLGAIRLNADLLLAEHAKMPPQELEHVVQQVALGTQAAHDVVRDYRRFFSTAGTSHVPVQLPPLLADLARGLQAEFARQQVRLTLVRGPQALVMGDAVQLETAVSGLLHFMLQQCRVYKQPLQMSWHCQGRHVYLRLLATGLALSGQTYAQAFVRTGNEGYFSQSLWLSRALLEHHGGAMNLHAEGADTGISAQLPLIKEDAHE